MNEKKIPFAYRVLILLFATTISRIPDLSFDMKFLIITAASTTIAVSVWYLMDYAIERFLKRAIKN